MVVDEVIGATPEVILEIGRLGNWIQAVGVLVILWIIFHVITLFFNRKRRKMIEEIREDVKKIDRKINKLEKKIVKRR